MWGKIMSSKKTKGKPAEGDKKIGFKLRTLRNKVGLSQGQLGSRIGLSFQQIQKYEKGLNRISGLRLYEISKIFEVELSYFFEELDEPLNEQLQAYRRSLPIQKFKGVLPEKNLRFELNIFDHKAQTAQTSI